MDKDQPEIEYEVEKTELKKSVGLTSGVALIVGTMIGSGVFISPKGVLEGTGSIGFSLIIWIFCGLLSTLGNTIVQAVVGCQTLYTEHFCIWRDGSAPIVCTKTGALAYAELGTSIPRSGGEHAYLMYTFGEGSSKIAKLPAFLFDWMGLFVLRPTMFTVAMLAMGTYTVKPFFPGCTDVPDLPVKLITIAAMLLLGAINTYSVKLATRLQLVTTASKLLAIAIIAIGGLYQLIAERTLTVSDVFADTKEDASLISTAFYNGLWAYDGWNNLNFITEEIKNPDKNLPRSIMLGIPLTSFAYLIANIGFFAVLTKPEILASHAVAVSWSNYMLGVMSWIMPVFVVLSCFGAANGVLFATGRLCFAAARDKNLPEVLSYIQIKRLTPMPSIMFTVIISLFIVLPGDISTLIDFYGFSVWVWYCVTIVALLVLRKTQPDLHRPYKVPIVIPVIVLVIGLYLTISPIIQTGRMTFFYAIVFMLIGVIVYFPFIYYKVHIHGKEIIYRALQKWLQVVPTH